MPVRQIPKNYRSVTGFFASLKNNRNIAFESTLERDFFLYLEFQKDVKSYEEQPLTIPYTKDTRTYRYTPDALVFYNNTTTNKKPCICEIKYSSELEEVKRLFKEKFDQMNKYVKKNNMDFKFFTETMIDPTLLKNIKFLYSFKDISNEKKLNEVYSKIVSLKESIYIDFLLTFSSDKFIQAEIIPYIWKLVVLGKVEIDLYQKISNQTILRVYDEKN